MRGNRGGGRPKPTALHELHGTARKDRHAKRAAEPKPVGDPDWFAPGELEQWQYAIKNTPAGVVKLLDRNALILWCEASERHRLAMLALAETNRRYPKRPYLVIKKGVLAVSPLVAVIDKAAAVMLRCAQELGFTPAARPRLRADPVSGAAADAAHQGPDPWKSLQVIKGGKT
jgi:P27 family predicted phage terminase small subunit